MAAEVATLAVISAFTLKVTRTMGTPWHAQREEVFALMRQIDESVQHAWTRARELGPRYGAASIGSADFDYTIKATVGEQYLRVLRTGGDPVAAFGSSIEAGKEAIGKWNSKGCMSRVVVTGRYELHRNECSAESIALGFHSRFVKFLDVKPAPIDAPVREPDPVVTSRVMFQPAVVDGSRYCGPVCLSAISGIGTKQIASILRKQFDLRAVRGVNLRQMKWFIDSVGYRLVMSRIRAVSLEHFSQSANGVFLIAFRNHWLLLNGTRIVCTESSGSISDVAGSSWRHKQIESAYEIQGELSDSAVKIMLTAQSAPLAKGQKELCFG